ncbi:unnamed protein product, partial [Mesorhabditis spiculigera]
MRLQWALLLLISGLCGVATECKIGLLPCLTFEFLVTQASYEAGHVPKPGDERFTMELKEWDKWNANDKYHHCIGNMYGQHGCRVIGQDTTEMVRNEFYLKFHFNAEYTTGKNKTRCVSFGWQNVVTSARRSGQGRLHVFPEPPFCRLDYSDVSDGRARNGTALCYSCCDVLEQC